MFLATIADGKQLLHGDKGRNIAKIHPESTLNGSIEAELLDAQVSEVTSSCLIILDNRVALQQLSWRSSTTLICGRSLLKFV